MAPFGKLYAAKGNPHANSSMAIAEYNNLEVELVPTKIREEITAEYLKLNRLGKIPTFEGADGFVLTESIAITVYLTVQDEKTLLLGDTKQDYASILRWMSYCNMEVLAVIGSWIRPLLGIDPYIQKGVDAAEAKCNKGVQTLEDHLSTRTFLVGERITLADIYGVSCCSRGFSAVFDKQWRTRFVHVTRWFETVVNQPWYKAANGELLMIQEAIKPPVKDKAPPKAQEQKKEAPKPKAKDVDDDAEEDDKPAPKPKHPLEELGKPKFALDDWKRQFKNQDSRKTALPWFWEHTNFDEYSIWQVDYKYNDELTQTFMSSNLIGGLFTRLEGSRKYIQGCCSVFGKANDSVIRGAFVVRGQEVLPAFDVAPDYESYDFKKLEPNNADDKAFFEDMMAWDKPVQVNGKTYDWADGKVFV